MAKLITVSDAAANALAPRVVRRPGVGGYAARFIADHLTEGPGAKISRWESLGGTTPMTLATLGASAATTTIVVENGIRHISSPGGSDTGGRLLGPHLANRPQTLAAVVRMEAGREDFMGVAGVTMTRETAGIYLARSGKAAYTTTNHSGWAFVLFAQAADNSFVMRADGVEATQASGANPPANSGGLFFGATAPGDSADVREIVYWTKQLNATERSAVHAYMRSQYPELA